MLTLAIDTSTPAVTVGVADLGETVTMRATRAHVDARAHAEQLTPLIAAALAEADATPADLGAIVAGLGPGPFTGLRVGLSTAAAMGHALDIPTYGVCSLDGIGAAVTTATGPFLVATDARRKEVYWALYAQDGQRVDGPSVDKPADLASKTAPGTGALGAGAHQYADILGLDLIDGPQHPDPAALLRLAAERVRDGAPTEQLTPLYLRRPDVHVNGQRTRA
ncbi:tRNA (adenosine(37)-N6)-threonylcarbamoyltransferase complex dimerization subunit type 1 TsaB [Stackebrandtia soli]|uniref:tRNA (adenosine(37)-N6)-threonylcarbamoyltransferase complex dimerization subunit type 1 TsaB n=1 Tax=Stackebrandtia soli TaxID=1892856 RepID=UPI0039ECC678